MRDVRDNKTLFSFSRQAGGLSVFRVFHCKISGKIKRIVVLIRVLGTTKSLSEPLIIPMLSGDLYD